MRVVAFMLSLLACLNAGATTYTFGSGGDFATVADINWAGLSAGDVLDGQGQTFAERMDIGASGSSGNPIIIQNFTLDGEDSLATVLTFYDSAAAEHITLRDVTLKRSTGHGLNFSPTATSATMAGVRLERVVSEDHAQNCFKLGDPTGGGGFPSLVAVDITARRCGNVGIALSGQSGAYLLRPYVDTAGINGGNLDGIAVDDGADGTIVMLPQVHNQRGGQAIDIQDSSGSARNYVIMAYVVQADDLSTIDGISVTGSSPTTVAGSVVVGGRDAYIAKSTADHWLYNSIAQEPTQYGVRAGLSTLNGTLKLRGFAAVRPGGKAVWVRDDAGSSIDTDGNVYVTDLGQPFTYKGTSYNLADWRTQTSGDANSSVEPESTALFQGGDSPSTFAGFKPTASSPLIRAGTCYLTTGCVHYDYEGKRARVPPDIGALQRNQ